MDVTIVDIQGKVLLQQSTIFDNDHINISSYIPGVYFVKIITPEGGGEIRVTKY